MNARIGVDKADDFTARNRGTAVACGGDGAFLNVCDATAAGFGNLYRVVGRGVIDGLRMLLPTVLASIALIPLSLIPAAGTAVAAVLGAAFGGWFLSVELTGQSFDARGRSLAERRARLRSRLLPAFQSPP